MGTKKSKKARKSTSEGEETGIKKAGNGRISTKVAQKFWSHVEGQIVKSNCWQEFSFPVDNYREEILNLPPYRKLRQNLYRPPLSRPTFNEDIDAYVCNCSLSTGGCGQRCQNRLIYTYVCFPPHSLSVNMKLLLENAFPIYVLALQLTR